MKAKPAPINSRREFLIAASSMLAASTWAGGESTKTRQPICVFTKPFNSLSFDELADAVAEIGFDGIEAPIRAGGHVEPAEVEDKLPELVDALGKRGLEITVSPQALVELLDASVAELAN